MSELRPAFLMLPAERRQFALWWRRLLLLFALFAVVALTQAFFARKFASSTGRAEWIWYPHWLASGDPTAFFAVKDFDLPERRDQVRIKVAGDPEYTLYFNGVEIGGARDAEKNLLAVYDVTKYANTGHNRIVTALRSANGVGGFLLSLDLSRTKENVVFTDSSWKMYDSWRDDLLFRDPSGAAPKAPLVIGKPPFGRWNYLGRNGAEVYRQERSVLKPVASRGFDTTLPDIRVVNGIAVAVARPVRATLFDFGRVVEARGQVISGRPGPTVILARYATNESDAEQPGQPTPFVVARGERAVTDPDTNAFRYMVVYEAEATTAAIAGSAPPAASK